MNKRSIPLFITVADILLIVFIAVVARWSLRNNEKNNSISVVANNYILIDDSGLNESEILVLMRISSLIILPNDQTRESENQAIYLKYLYEYLRSPGVELSESTAIEIKKLVKNRDQLMYLEKEYKVSNMSFDGRNAAVYILKRIYELCGLKLKINMNGEIEQVTDLSGSITYQKKNLKEQAGIQVESLLITVTIILTLLIICFILAKKNQIFEKGGRYDGFDEKKIA